MEYFILDVFTGTALEGNPLAAVINADHLDDAAMQRIAGEFNLSETIFLTTPANAANRANIRIFTRTLELPFAGHPTVGAAALIAHLDRRDNTTEMTFTLEEKVGILPCTARLTGENSAHAGFVLPKRPATEPAHGAREALAAALSLEPDDIGFSRHAALEMSAGTPFTSVPVRNLETLARATPRPDLWVRAFGNGSHAAAFVYTALPETEADSYRARVFAPNQGIREDPATGSASAAFIGAFTALEKPGDGHHNIVIQQGYEMGRPSRLHLSISIKSGAVASAFVGGDAVIVAQGRLFL